MSVDPVTFYRWIDAGDRHQPSSMTLRIAGGEYRRDASGRAVSMGYHEVKFKSGMYQTSNPIEIREIRKLAKHDTITEDEELYLSKIEDPKHRAERLARESGELDVTIKSQAAELGRLKALLLAKNAS